MSMITLAAPPYGPLRVTNQAFQRYVLEEAAAENSHPLHTFEQDEFTPGAQVCEACSG